MKVLYCLALVVCVVGVCGKVAPDGFPQCKRSDPQIEKCILDGIEKFRPKLISGVPELNIPAIEPFLVPTLKLDRTAPNLRLKAVVKQMMATGGSNFRIDKLKLNLNNKYAAELKMFFPKLSVSAEYDVKGSRLLVIELNGKGKLKGNFTGITVVIKGNAKPTEKGGVTYLQADKISTKLKISHAQIALDGAERPGAAQSATSFFNASPNVVLDILNPLIEETAAAILKAFINKILITIPLNEILIEDA